MGIIVGPTAKNYADKRDKRADKIMQAEKRHEKASKEARTARREAQATLQELYKEEEGILYGPGIAD